MNDKNKYFSKKLFFIIILLFLFTMIIFSTPASSIRPALKHNLEKKYIQRLTLFCKSKSITVKIMPVFIKNTRSLFVYFENIPNYQNFLSAVKLLTARYLLPLWRDVVKKRISKIKYFSVILYLKGKKKILTSSFHPSHAIQYTANRITRDVFLKRTVIKITSR